MPAEFGSPSVVCAWCGVLIERGGRHISHGICQPCHQQFMRALTTAVTPPVPGSTPTGGHTSSS